MTASMYEDFLRTLLRLQVAVKEVPEQKNPLEGKVSYSSPEAALSSSETSAQRVRASKAQAEGMPAAPPKPAPTGKTRPIEKDKDDPFAGIGRNDPCPCGSGKKFKKCHGANF